MPPPLLSPSLSVSLSLSLSPLSLLSSLSLSYCFHHVVCHSHLHSLELHPPCYLPFCSVTSSSPPPSCRFVCLCVRVPSLRTCIIVGVIPVSSTCHHDQHQTTEDDVVIVLHHFPLVSCSHENLVNSGLCSFDVSSPNPVTHLDCPFLRTMICPSHKYA